MDKKGLILLFLFITSCGRDELQQEVKQAPFDVGLAESNVSENRPLFPKGASSWPEDLALQETSTDNFPTIPIFIINCDRVTDLKKAIASYHASSKTPIEIIIHDNHSTYPEMVSYLKELEDSGILVVRSGSIVQDSQLNSVADTIDSWFQTHDAPYYVVTDPDIEMEEGPGTVLQLYAHLLRWHPEVNVVGPMLRVDDLPDAYPLKQQVIRSHVNHFRGRPTFWMTWDDKPVLIQRGALDTTFAMYRKGFRFRRLNNSLQVNEPFRARHLDWYLDPEHLAGDQIFYIKNSSRVAHWGGSWLKDSLPASK